jgi:hypothetical protein
MFSKRILVLCSSTMYTNPFLLLVVRIVLECNMHTSNNLYIDKQDKDLLQNLLVFTCTN